ncbi:Uncharacterised protein [BD1-7 clade bacterium]|uniref:Uncharacterized protein n=1 Tax=BD1-7 clade bacterium TaxID=2029982 RepID=A0A5S9PP46_9GAMM|nr:Uncharacterised protein [BD1-7 clade bacterium]
MPINVSQSIRLMVAGGFITLITACSFAPTKSNVENLADQQRYDAAIDAWEDMPELLQQQVDIDGIRKARNIYETATVATLKQLVRQNNYVEAQPLVLDLQQNIPESNVAKKAVDAYYRSEKVYMQRYQHQYNQELARFLIKEQPILNKLRRGQTRNRKNQELADDRQREREELSVYLGEYGLAALKRGHRITAKTNLMLAEHLNSDKRWRKGLSNIEQYNQTREDARLAELKQQQNTAWQTSADAYLVHFMRKNWLSARKQLRQIISLSDTPEQKAWHNAQRQQLQEIIDQEVNQAFQRGLNLYSQGYIDQAIAIWAEVLPLSPNHPDLNESLQRAKSFQRTYKELQPDKTVEF